MDLRRGGTGWGGVKFVARSGVERPDLDVTLRVARSVEGGWRRWGGVGWGVCDTDEDDGERLGARGAVRCGAVRWMAMSGPLGGWVGMCGGGGCVLCWKARLCAVPRRDDQGGLCGTR